MIGGQWAGDSAALISRPRGYAGVVIDTRQLRKREVFFCLKGAKTDGHRFADVAAKKGAAAIVAKRNRRGFSNAIAGVPVLGVDDPQTALADWATAYRRDFATRFIAITGSVGKTSTKEMVSAIFSRKYRTFKSPGNYNNLLGIPLALPALSPEHQYGVVEFGMSSPGEIAALTQMIKPELGVITWIGPAHLEFFSDLKAIANAKRELFDYLPRECPGVVNIDSPILARWKNRMKRRMYGYSIHRETDFFATHIHVDFGETRFKLNGREWIRLPLLGGHHVANALAACAVARIYGIGFEKIRAGLLQTPQLPRRLEVKKSGQVTILDDSYNSNPASAQAALQVLCALRPPGKKIACLGAMRELGKSALHHHKDVGRAAATHGVDLLLGVGHWGRAITTAARKVGGGIVTQHTKDVESAIPWLQHATEPGDVLLIKASRAEGFDRIVDAFVR